ncbi:hypothetical protein HB777_36300 (plasmid) [Mesorhizobium loti]|nr:hypothetical protein HB777_36300 [Mesorhizobium loti]
MRARCNAAVTPLPPFADDAFHDRFEHLAVFAATANTDAPDFECPIESRGLNSCLDTGVRLSPDYKQGLLKSPVLPSTPKLADKSGLFRCCVGQDTALVSGNFDMIVIVAFSAGPIADGGRANGVTAKMTG